MRRPEVTTGGLCWIVFAKWEDVLYWPQVHPKTGVCSSPIQLIPGRTWYECQLVDKGRIFNENQKASGAGPYWEMQVNGYLAGNNTGLTLSAATMQYHQFVVMLKDRDSQIRFIGNADSGADWENNYNSGDRDNTRKRTGVFSWQNPLPAPVYVGNLDDIVDDLITPPFANEGDFGNDFGDDFSN